jgi:hypothetical protein
LPQSLDIHAIESIFVVQPLWMEFLQPSPVSLDLLFSLLDPAGPEMKRPTRSIRSDAGTAGGWASLTRRQNLGTLMLPPATKISIKEGAFHSPFHQHKAVISGNLVIKKEKKSRGANRVSADFLRRPGGQASTQSKPKWRLWRFSRKRFGVFGVLRGTFWPENDEKALK